MSRPRHMRLGRNSNGPDKNGSDIIGEKGRFPCRVKVHYSDNHSIPMG